MSGLKEKNYVTSARKRSAPISLVVSLAIFAVCLGASAGSSRGQNFFDLQSFLVVVGGTLASMIFQFDLSALAKAMVILMKSLGGTPDKGDRALMLELDEAIIRGKSVGELRDGNELTGEYLNDVVYMYQKGLSFDEIDEFVTGRVKNDFFEREIASQILQKSAIVAPAFGLFGTVIGLVHVMQSMSNPSTIGPSMSLALMTTAYGAGLASIVFTPLAGRLEHHNMVFLESQKQLLSKLSILITRETERFDSLRRQDRKSVA